jgi:membrane protein DedA with SNARE-associated domain
MGKTKNFLKKDIDLGLVISVPFCLFLGVYKVFFQTDHRVWSLIYGWMIISVFVYVLGVILAKLKSKNTRQKNKKKT